MPFFFFPLLILVELTYWPIQSTDPIMLKILLTQINKFADMCLKVIQVACCWMDGLIGWFVMLHTGVCMGRCWEVAGSSFGANIMIMWYWTGASRTLRSRSSILVSIGGNFNTGIGT